MRSKRLGLAALCAAVAVLFMVSAVKLYAQAGGGGTPPAPKKETPPPAKEATPPAKEPAKEPVKPAPPPAKEPAKEPVKPATPPVKEPPKPEPPKAEPPKPAAPAAKEVTLTGKVVDLHCFMTGEYASADKAKCTADCIKAGVPAALETKDGLVILGKGAAGPAKDITPMAYMNAKVTGKMFEKGGLKYLDVTKIEKAD